MPMLGNRSPIRRRPNRPVSTAIAVVIMLAVIVAVWLYVAGTRF